MSHRELMRTETGKKGVRRTIRAPFAFVRETGSHPDGHRGRCVDPARKPFLKAVAMIVIEDLKRLQRELKQQRRSELLRRAWARLKPLLGRCDERSPAERRRDRTDFSDAT